MKLILPITFLISWVVAQGPCSEVCNTIPIGCHNAGPGGRFGGNCHQREQTKCNTCLKEKEVAPESAKFRRRAFTKIITRSSMDNERAIISTDGTCDMRPKAMEQKVICPADQVCIAKGLATDLPGICALRGIKCSDDADCPEGRSYCKLNVMPNGDGSVCFNSRRCNLCVPK